MFYPIFKLPIPPSTAIICPVTQLAFSDNKKAMALATSVGLPTFFKGLRFCIASNFSGVFTNLSPRGLLTKDGATQFTLTLGASSAASDFVSPSTAPLAIAILA